MHAYIQLMTKVISISDAAYDTLKGMKTEDESFTRVILRLGEQREKHSLLDFFGAWPGDKKELNAIKGELEKERKAFKTREVAF